MPIKSTPKEASVHADPLSFVSDIEILSGNTSQTYNRDTGEFVPDRTLVPLILMPAVSVSDPDKSITGVRPIASVEWYKGAPKSDKSNLIAAGDNYEIGDGTVSGFPKFALKVKKNIDPDTPEELFALFTVVDTRTNTEVLFERSKRLYTAIYDSQNYSVKLDVPKTWTVDPLQETADGKGRWMHTLTAQLYVGKEAVPDANAAYWWEVYDSGEWRALNDDDVEVWIDGRNDSGNWGHSISFDARMISAPTAFRVRAAYYDGQRPAAPTSEELQATTAVKVELPQSLNADIRQTKGMKIAPGMKTPVAYECMLTYNKGIIPSDKHHLFRVQWFGKSAKVGASEVLIGEGRTIEFVPADKGFDASYPVSIYAAVSLYHHYALMTDGNRAITDSSGALIIVPVFE